MSSKESTDVDVTCKMESFSRVVRLKLVGYSLAKCFGNEFHIELGTLDLAGHSWAIKFYPKGASSYRDGSDYISFICVLLTEMRVPLNVEYEFCLVDQNGKPLAARKGNQMIREKGCDFGICNYMKRSEFESSEYLNDDCFTLQCTLRVVKLSYIDMTKKQVVPSSGLHQHYDKLLESREGTDVIFEVNGEIFMAHKIVLASRSLVFNAHFFGSMMKTEANCMKIKDVKPEVFKLMLHFIYTDNLPDEVEISSEMAQHLLVVADRYVLERLKLISAEILCESFSVENSATTLVLAEQHNCRQLKEVCIDFVSSREVLDDVMASEGFGHLLGSCPLLLIKLKNGQMSIEGNRFRIPFTYAIPMRRKEDIQMLIGCNFIRAMQGGLRIEGQMVTFYKNVTTIATKPDAKVAFKAALEELDLTELEFIEIREAVAYNFGEKSKWFKEKFSGLLERLRNQGYIGNNPIKQEILSAFSLFCLRFFAPCNCFLGLFAWSF